MMLGIVLCYRTIRDSGDIYRRRGVDIGRNVCSKGGGKKMSGESKLSCSVIKYLFVY